MRRLESVLTALAALSVSLCFCTGAAAQPVFDPAHRYSLPELIDVAQSNQPDTRIAWANARSAALAVGVAEGTFLPRLAATVIAGQSLSQGQSETLGVNVGGNSNASGTVSALALQWLLFDFGERSAQLDFAQQTASAGQQMFTAAHQRVVHAVCLAYYAYSAAHSHLSTAEQALQNAQAIEAAAAERWAHGIGTVIEVAQARQASAQMRLSLVQARGAQKNAYQSLINAMGIAPLSQLQIADVPQRSLPAHLDGTLDDIVAQALARRPDILAARDMQQASEAGVRAAQADFGPKLYLGALGGYATGTLGLGTTPPLGPPLPAMNFSGSHWGSTVMLGVNFPLFDGHTRDAALSQARLNVDKANASYEQAKNQAVQQIVLAQNALETSLAANEAAAALVVAAQTTYDAALDAYRHGVASVTDATAAQTQLLLAHQADSDAYHQALAAAATLAFATAAPGGL
jgi:outer membrane protein TolC